jgi:flagellar basal body-associated protein FliL
MAEKSTVAVEVKVDSTQAEKSVGNIRSRLKEARTELINAIENFGEFSQQAVNAAKKIEGLKGTIDDASRLVNAFDGDRKFQAFSGAIGAVANGFTAAQGAIGLFGAESEDVEKVLLKVNSAMALSQGIDGVLEGVKSFKALKKVLLDFSVVQKIVTVAQTIFNAVMAANPIGALIVAIAALIAGIVALTSYFMSNAKANRENAKAVEENTKALKKQQEATKILNDELARSQAFQLAMAKANGASTKAIRALELKLIDEKIATERASRETALNTLQKENKGLRDQINKIKQGTRKFTKDDYRKIADKVRKLKAPKDVLFAVPVPTQLWDAAVEIVATAIETAGDIAIAINEALDTIRNSDWYKSLADEGKKKFDKYFTDEITKQYEARQNVEDVIKKHSKKN